MRTTIKDIARIANVSHTTVSRALRDHPGIASETTARIKQIAVELDYVPSAAARSLKTQRSQAIGVVVNRIADPFFAEVLDGIDDVLQAAGYGLLLSTLNHDAGDKQATLDVMLEQQVEGLIVCSTFVDETSYDRLSRAGIPIVLVHNHALETFDYSLNHDDVYGGMVMTRYLLGLGHVRIAYVANSMGCRVSDHRLAGYLAALREAKLPVRDDYIVDARGGDLADGARAAQALLDCTPMPTAVFCYNDRLAIAVMQAFERAGISVPQDCSVSGFDNIALTAYVRPALTTFEQPKYTLGEAAARMLLKRVERREQEIEATVVTFRGTIVPRESTARLAM